MLSVFAIVILSIVAGFGDAFGFTHAARVWDNGKLIWSELAKSALGFTVGISSYWMVIRYLNNYGFNSASLQTIIWFTVTIIGVAILSGDFVKWSILNKSVAVAVLFGIGWLMLNESH